MTEPDEQQAESPASLVGRVADEFLARQQRGEQPDPEEFAAKYPEAADLIRRTLAALRVVGGSLDAQVLSAEAPPAMRLLGDFLLRREIGRGGMGVVYEAEQVSLGRRVALKLLTQRLLTDDNQRRRFEREARAAARLHHPNIVPVHGYGEHDGNPYYVMQLISGQGLDAVIQEVASLERRDSTDPMCRHAAAVSLVTGVFRPEEAPEVVEGATGISEAAAKMREETRPTATPSGTVPGMKSSARGRNELGLTYWQGVARIGAQAAQALEYAHRQGVIHRDIKPSNLLLDMSCTVWVTDFGLAKSDGSENLTHTGDVLGTLRYMPPEAFEGAADARSDVYALGLTLYELLALRPAFDERDRNKLIRQVTTQEPRRLRQARPGVPRDLETIVLKAIERDPAKRYQKAEELAADLQRFLNNEPIRARRQTPLDVGWWLLRRHPAVAVSVAVAAAALVAVAITSLALMFEAQAREQAQVQYAANLDIKKREVEDALADARRQSEKRAEALQASAQLEYNRGRQLAEEGETAAGLLWMARALETLPPGNNELEREFRMSIDAWVPFAARLKSAARFDLPPQLSGDLWQGLLSSRESDSPSRGQSGRLIAPLSGWNRRADLSLGGGVLAFSTNSDRAIILANSDSIRVISATTGRAIGPDLRFPSRGILQSADFVPGSDLVFMAGSGQTAFLHPATGKLAGPVRSSRTVRFWPQGKRAVVAEAMDAGTVVRFLSTIDGSEQEKPLSLSCPAKQFQWADLACEGNVVVAHTGPEMLLLSRHGKEIGRVPVPSWSQSRWFGEPEPIPSPTLLSPDRRTIWMQSAKTWAAFDAATGKPLDLPAAEDKNADRHVVLSGSRAALCDGNRLRLWDSASGKLIGDSLEVAGLASFAFTADGRTLLALVNEREIRRWEVETGQSAGPGLLLPAPSRALVVSEDGRYLLRLDRENRVTLWDLRRGLRQGETMTMAGVVNILGFVSGGRGILVGEQVSEGGVVRQYGFPPDGPRLGPEASSAGAELVFRMPPVYCSDGSRYTVLASPRRPGGKRDEPDSLQTLFAWESEKGQPLEAIELSAPPGGRSELYSTHGHGTERILLRTTTSSVAQIWDVIGARSVGEPFAGGPGEARFTSDGRRLLLREPDPHTGGHTRFRTMDAATGCFVGMPLTVPDNRLVWGGWIGDIFYLMKRDRAEVPNGRVEILDVQANRVVGTIERFGALVWAGPVGDRLYVVTRDRPDELDGPAEIRDVGANRVVGTIEHLGQGVSVYAETDGRLLIIDRFTGSITLPDGKQKQGQFERIRIFRTPVGGEKAGQWIGEPIVMSYFMGAFSPSRRVVVGAVYPGEGFAAYSLIDGKRLGGAKAPTPRALNEWPAVDDNGELLAVFGPNRTVQLWNLRTGDRAKESESVQVFGLITPMSFLPNSAELVVRAVLTPDGRQGLRVLIIDGQTGKTIRGPYPLQTAGGSVLGNSHILGGEPQLTIQEGKLLTKTQGGLATLDLSSGESQITARFPAEAKVVADHLLSGRVFLDSEQIGYEFIGERGQTLGPMIPNIGPVNSSLRPSLSTDARRVLLQRANSRLRKDLFDFQVYDVASGRPLGTPLSREGFSVTSAQLGPAGDAVVGLAQRGDATELCWWDAGSGALLGTATVASNHSTHIMWTDARTCVTIQSPRDSVDFIHAVCRVWDVPTRTLVNTIELPKNQRLNVFNHPPDGFFFYSVQIAERMELSGLEVRTGCRIVGPLPLAHGVNQIALSPDRQLLVTRSESEIAVWSMWSGRMLGRPWGNHDKSIPPVFSMHPTGRSIVAVSAKGRIQEWSLPRVTNEKPEEITQRLEALTGLHLDATGTTHVLTVPHRDGR